MELKSQVESLESEVKNFKALIFQMIKKQNSTIPAPTKVARVSQLQTISNKSGRVQKTFSKMRQAQTSIISAPILMASTSKHDPTDLSFLDDV